jgi:IS1 family transposase
MLCEGNSLRSTARLADVSFNTVLKLVPLVGEACMKFHDEKVRGVKSQIIQADEIWSFVYSKQKNVPKGMEGQAGDVWTWTGIDADSKLIVSWYVGNRDAESADIFMHDVAARLASGVQLTTDGLKVYLKAVENAFEGKIDYAQLVKLYGPSTGENPTERKYSPNECTGFKIERICGNPDPFHISTSYVERQNLNIRMGNRRFTRLTNAFSKKIENHAYAIAIYFVYYNWVRIHKTLRVTPAMEAGLTNKLMEVSDMVKLVEKYK